MPRTAEVWNNPTIKIATTEAGLATGPAIECQVTSAVLTPNPVFNTIPATGCAPATQSPGRTGWQLDLAWLQDWSKGDATVSLSRFAYENDAMPVWVQITPNAADATDNQLTGQFYCVSGGYGATLGDGSAAVTTATWPAVDKPEITPAGAVTVAAADDAELAPA